MPLRAWHRPTSFYIIWILIVAIISAQNDTKSKSEWDSFTDVTLFNNLSSREKLLQEATTSTEDYSSSLPEKIEAITSRETSHDADTPTQVTSETKNERPSTEKVPLRGNDNQAPFGTKIRTSGPHAGEDSVKKEIVAPTGQSFHDALRNNSNDNENSGSKIGLEEQGHAPNDAEFRFKKNASGQDEETREDNTSPTSTNVTLHHVIEETEFSSKQLSSPVTFTRAHLLPSVSIYDDEIDSEFFRSASLPFGSRFSPRTSAFYSDLNPPKVEHSRWSSNIWSPVYTAEWLEEPFVTCRSGECHDDEMLRSPTASFFSPSFGDDPVSSIFFRADRELWVNNYKGNSYIDPSKIATEILRTKSRSQFSVSPNGESETQDITVLGYVPLDEDFGMRITKTNSFPLVLETSEHTLSTPSLNGISNVNAEITADNTIPVEFEKKTTKDLNNRPGFELGTSYSETFNGNFPVVTDNSGGASLKTNKWTTVKAGDGNTRGEIGIHLDNSSHPGSLVASDFFVSTSTSGEAENVPNSLFLLSVDLINHSVFSLGRNGQDIVLSTPTVFEDYAYNSFGVLQMFNVSSTPALPLVESTTGENKNEIKFTYGNLSFADTHYRKNAIEYDKQGKIVKSREQSTTQQQQSLGNSGQAPFSLRGQNSFHTIDSFSYLDVVPNDTLYADQIPMHSEAFLTSSPFVVTPWEYDSSFGDRIFSKQPQPTSTFGMSTPAMISTVNVNDAMLSPYLLSSFYGLSSSYDQYSPNSESLATPFMFSSMLNSDYLTSSYWEKQAPGDSVFKEYRPMASADTRIHFVSNIIHTEDSKIISSTPVMATPIIYHNPTEDTFTMLESSIFYFASSLYPYFVSSSSVGRSETDGTAATTTSVSPSSSTASTLHPPQDHTEPNPSAEDHDVPPPRITNPSCSSLPTCITMTIGMSWSEFCPVSENLRRQLAESLSQIIKPIHPHQLVLSSDHQQCKTPGQDTEVFSRRKRRRRRRRRSESFVEIRIFVIDHDGEYDEKLTEICGVILKKWIPTAGAPFQNKILEVRISHIGEDLEETSVPETIPAESPTSTGIIAAITISTIAGACLFLLCILLVVMKQRLIQNRNCNPALDAYSLDSFSINASFRRRRVRQSMRSFLNHAFEDPELPSHPLSESGLVNCLKNADLLEEEFKKLPMNMPKLEQIPPGAEVKNRYANVLPNPDTRVLLSVSTEDPLKEYINANYVKGYDGKHRAYIATQAPLPETVNDFWQMVWEQQCKVIIMLTLLEENGVSRCASYFPESTLDCHKLYGDFQVSLQKKDIREFYTMSTFRLYHLEKNLFREVVHFWYTAWPPLGVPSDPGYLVTFLLQARPFINTNSGPTVVHCSPGTGRTGVVLALDMSMREFEQSRSVDLLRCIARIRKDRGGAVQNKEQYVLLHEAMVEYASYISNQSHRPSIRSNN